MGAHFGMHFAGTFDHCAAIEGGIGDLTHAEEGVANQQALCASNIFEVVSGLTGLAANGYIVSKACETPKSQRLYAEGIDEEFFRGIAACQASQEPRNPQFAGTQKFGFKH